jgi:hypothetical protein
VVWVAGEDGSDQGTYDFSDADGPARLRDELVSAFAGFTVPEGTWRRRRTGRTAALVLRKFLRFILTLDPPPVFARDLTPGAWAAWRLVSPTERGARCNIGVMRALLRRCDGLAPAVRAAVGRRTSGRPPVRECSYSPRGVPAHPRRGPALGRAAERGRLILGQLLDHIGRSGDVPPTRCGMAPGTVSRARSPLPRSRSSGKNGRAAALARRFPTVEEIGALAVMLVCIEGWNASVIDEMPVPSQEPSGGLGSTTVWTVEVIKRRRRAGSTFATNTVVDAGPGSSGRVMAQALAMTAPARATLASVGEPADLLLVARRVQGDEGSLRGPERHRPVAHPAWHPASCGQLSQDLTMRQRLPGQAGNARETGTQFGHSGTVPARQCVMQRIYAAPSTIDARLPGCWSYVGPVSTLAGQARPWGTR